MWISTSACLWIWDNGIGHFSELRMQEHQSTKIISNRSSKQKKKESKSTEDMLEAKKNCKEEQKGMYRKEKIEIKEFINRKKNTNSEILKSVVYLIINNENND